MGCLPCLLKAPRHPRCYCWLPCAPPTCVAPVVYMWLARLVKTASWAGEALPLKLGRGVETTSIFRCRIVGILSKLVSIDVVSTYPFTHRTQTIAGDRNVWCVNDARSPGLGGGEVDECVGVVPSRPELCPAPSFFDRWRLLTAETKPRWRVADIASHLDQERRVTRYGVVRLTWADPHSTPASPHFPSSVGVGGAPLTDSLLLDHGKAARECSGREGEGAGCRWAVRATCQVQSLGNQS